VSADRVAELDLSNPVSLRAEMARSGLHDLTPYDDPERGWTDPLDDREQRGLARVFLHNLWVACLRAEKEQG
jgi:hypothetical protein